MIILTTANKTVKKKALSSKWLRWSPLMNFSDECPQFVRQNRKHCPAPWSWWAFYTLLTSGRVEPNILFFIEGAHLLFRTKHTAFQLQQGLCLMEPWPLPSGKPGFLHQGGDKPEHAGAYDNLLWWGPEEDFQPDGKGFIPPLPQVPILSRFGQPFQLWIREAERSQEFCRLSFPGPPVCLILTWWCGAEMSRLYAWKTWGQILICTKHQYFLHIVT